jgi:hypothetical protein
MKETLLNVANIFTVETAIEYYEKLGVAVEVNDGRDITLRIEGEVE